MEKLDISTFFLFKTDINTQELNSEIIKNLNIIFPDYEKKNKMRNKNKVSILKNQKIQVQKENIFNKVNLILNKLSEKNIDNLIIEFIDNINQVNLDNFKEIQKTFYLKIISEINFINIYLEFLKIITFIYNKVQKYELTYFYDIIESKFKIDYTNYEIKADSQLNFLNELTGESNRINNLTLINNLIDNKFISNDIYKYCDNIIIEQQLFLSDIYYWYNNKKLSESDKIKIKQILNKVDIAPRDSILLKNLINEKEINKPKEEVNKPKEEVNKPKNNDIKKVITNTINLECEHIIEEYLLIKSIDDLKYFIDTRCIDTINKNKFCEILINKYFLSNKEISDEIIQLVKQLVISRILFKSNYSRGLNMIYNNWDELSIDYNNSITKIKLLLLTLKSIGITNGLEHLLEKYQV